MKKKEIVISDVLPRLLKERKLTAKKLSQATSVSQSTLSTWTLPKAKPRNIEDVATVADFLGVSLNYLLFGEADEPQDLQNLDGEIVLSGIYRLKLERLIIPQNKSTKE